MTHTKIRNLVPKSLTIAQFYIISKLYFPHYLDLKIGNETDVYFLGKTTPLKYLKNIKPLQVCKFCTKRIKAVKTECDLYKKTFNASFSILYF